MERTIKIPRPWATKMAVRYIIWNQYIDLPEWSHLRQLFFFGFLLLKTMVITLHIVVRCSPAPLCIWLRGTWRTFAPIVYSTDVGGIFFCSSKNPAKSYHLRVRFSAKLQHATTFVTHEFCSMFFKFSHDIRDNNILILLWFFYILWKFENFHALNAQLLFCEPPSPDGVM